MPRAFSSTSDGLGYLLGFALCRSSSVAILSPWLSDVRIPLPITDRECPRRGQLSEILDSFSDTDVRVFVKSDEEHNEYIRRRLPRHVNFETVDDLHAKAIVTPEFVYVGSANITMGGLQDNRELCEVIENEYGGVESFLSSELDLHF